MQETFESFIITIPDVVLFPRLLIPIHVVDPNVSNVLKHLETTGSPIVLSKSKGILPESVAGIGTVEIVKFNPGNGFCEALILGFGRVHLNELRAKGILDRYAMNLEIETDREDYLKKNLNEIESFKMFLQEFSFDHYTDMDTHITKMNNIYNVDDLVAFAVVRFIKKSDLRQKILECTSIQKRMNLIKSILSQEKQSDVA